MSSIPTDDDRSPQRGRWPIVVGVVVFLAGSLLHSPEHSSTLSLWTLISDSIFVFA
jgi:hypothetical protein